MIDEERSKQLVAVGMGDAVGVMLLCARDGAMSESDRRAVMAFATAVASTIGNNIETLADEVVRRIDDSSTEAPK